MKKSFVVLALSSFVFLASCNKQPEVINKYTIKFVNDDGTTLQTSEVEEGKYPVYEGETPSKIAPSEHEYVYIGWDKPIVKATEDTIYKASYDYVFLFGTYPQTLVSDSNLIVELDKITATDDYGYKSYNNKFYFSCTSRQNYIADDKTRVNKGDKNYYEVKQIRWKILDENEEKFYITYNLLDTTIYGATNNTWSTSDLRNWLNNTSSGFLWRAFKNDTDNLIASSTIKNDADSTCDEGNQYAEDDTTNKIFTLSRKELRTREYGFSEEDLDDNNRTAKTTDFARAEGSVLARDNYGMYWLRSPADNEFCFDNQNAYTTMLGGHIIQHSISDDGYCARPAIKLS